MQIAYLWLGAGAAEGHDNPQSALEPGSVSQTAADAELVGGFRVRQGFLGHTASSN